MPYAVKQDMVDRFSETEMIQLTDRAGDVNAIDDVVMNRALGDADAEIDAYLTPRYSLPLATLPRVLTNAACDIARYRLFADRATDQVSKRFDDAIKLLKMISKGEISLGVDQNQASTPTVGGAQWTTNGRIFTPGSMKDY